MNIPKTTTNEVQRAIAAVRRMYPRASDLFAYRASDCVVVLVRKRGLVGAVRYRDLDPRSE